MRSVSLTSGHSQLDVLGAEQDVAPDVLEGSGGRGAGVVVQAAAGVLAAPDGCPKALTVRTVLDGTQEGGGFH